MVPETANPAQKGACRSQSQLVTSLSKLTPTFAHLQWKSTEKLKYFHHNLVSKEVIIVTLANFHYMCEETNSLSFPYFANGPQSTITRHSVHICITAKFSLSHPFDDLSDETSTSKDLLDMRQPTRYG